jgi:curved DNA-binding protein CbpA
MLDPYQTLGVSSSASEEELRTAYRRLVQLHHPDHNGGSAESARRFEEVQDAYAQIRKQRQPVGRAPGAGGRAPRTAGQAPPRPASDPGLESRLEDLERQLREARAARAAREEAQQAARAAARAAAADSGQRPTDEELGYVKTDDSFAKILADAERELADRLSGVRDHPAAKRVADLLDDLGRKLR